MGYLFLINVIVILILAEDVIAIFYDVLALQFIQQLDDIGFSLSKVSTWPVQVNRCCHHTFELQICLGCMCMVTNNNFYA